MANPVRIELLNKENYDSWSMQVEALMTKNDTWKYVSGDTARPTLVAVTDRDYEILFNEHGAVIKDFDGQIRVVVERFGDLYYVKQGNEQTCAASTGTQDETLTLWHERLGHLNVADILHMVRNKAESLRNLRHADIVSITLTRTNFYLYLKIEQVLSSLQLKHYYVDTCCGILQ